MNAGRQRAYAALPSLGDPKNLFTAKGKRSPIRPSPCGHGLASKLLYTEEYTHLAIDPYDRRPNSLSSANSLDQAIPSDKPIQLNRAEKRLENPARVNSCPPSTAPSSHWRSPDSAPLSENYQRMLIGRLFVDKYSIHYIYHRTKRSGSALQERILIRCTRHNRRITKYLDT